MRGGKEGREGRKEPKGRERKRARRGEVEGVDIHVAWPDL